MPRLRTAREGPVDLRSGEQVSKANRPEGRPDFESGAAGAEAAKLEKFSDAGGLKSGGCPTQAWGPQKSASLFWGKALAVRTFWAIAV